MATKKKTTRPKGRTITKGTSPCFDFEQKDDVICIRMKCEECELVLQTICKGEGLGKIMVCKIINHVVTCDIQSVGRPKPKPKGAKKR